MTRENRAKQFAPFAALKGFEDGIKWKEKVYVDKKELSEESLERLDNKFKEIKKNDIITIVYYNKGEYLRVTGMVARIDITARVLQVINTKIKFEDIYDIETGND
ncbi:MAG: YolD-like family protein [Lachnospiraceae bacterium]|nr:YolD-like family protein [Lachnospiraceae bacterium]MBQ9392181.1 YolD-like family protein [Lachnospiraceae bacterium]